MRRVLATTGLALLLIAAPAARAGMPARAATFAGSVGVNVHMSYFDTSYGRWQKVRDKLVELGVHHVRDGACPGCREQRDRLLALARAGIRTDYVMGHPGGDSSLHALVNMVAGPMRSSLDSVEGPNEYDISGDRRWVRHLRSYQRVLFRLARANPSLHRIPVLGPTLVSGDDFRKLGNIARYADFGNVHPYAGGQVPGANLTYNEQVERKVAGRKPLVATEAGYTTATRSRGGNLPVSEAAQAQYVPRMYLDFFQAGIARTYDYELLDEKRNPRRTDPQQHYGLLRHNFRDKPAFRSLRALLTAVQPVGPQDFQLTPLNFEVSGDARSLLLQTGERTYTLAVWRNVSVWDPQRGRTLRVAPETVHVLLHDGAIALGVRDLGHAHELLVSGPEVSLTLRGMPQIVTITR